MMFRTASIATLIALGGCASTLAPVEVTRFHLGGDVTRGTIVPAAAQSRNGSSLEQATYDAAVSRELAQQGFTPAADSFSARYTFSAEIGRDTRERLAQRSPVSIGIGGGSFGRGFGGGLGASFGLGGNRSRETVITQLSVQIRERGGSTVWEGRAETEAPANAPSAQPGLAADKLARALFKDFPGETGRTISVK